MLGMFSYHFDPTLLRYGNWDNFLVGYTTEHFYFGGFRNSFDDWTIGVGLQRFFYRYDLAPKTRIKAGYRVGILYGYDQRLIGFAKRFKTVPFLLPFVEVQYHKVGLELTYFIRGVAAGMYCQLG